MNQQLKAIYEDPNDPGSYGGLDRLLKSARAKGLQVNRKQVAAFLRTHRPYTLHKPARKHYSRNPTIVSGIDVQWQADLVDMQSLSRSNQGYKYILTVIDCFSRFAWALPIKNKLGAQIIDAFKRIFQTSGRKPHKLQTDKGKEFVNKEFQKYLHDNGVEHFSTENETKAAMVERFNRTLKTRMWTYFTTHGTDKYVDVLDDLVEGYNKAVHRSIGMKPIDVKKKDEQNLFTKMYAKPLSKSSKAPDSVGPYVRISKAKAVFDKGYRPNWTGEVFKVKDKMKQTKAVMALEDLSKEPVRGRFYTEEVQTIDYDPDGPQPIEKIVRTRVRNGIKEHLVKWLDYPSSQNSWVPDSELEDIQQ